MHSQKVVIGSSADRVWACEYETRDCLHLPQVMLLAKSQRGVRHGMVLEHGEVPIRQFCPNAKKTSYPHLFTTQRAAVKELRV